MKKEIDCIMFSDWAEADDTAPVNILMDAGYDRRAATAIIFHIMRCLVNVSSADGVRPAKSYRRWLAELNFTAEEIDGILSTSIFEQVDGGDNNLYFSPYARQAQAIAKVNAKHERAVARGKASGVVPNKGRFKAGNKAACKHKEKVEEEKAEEVVSSYV